MFRTIKNILVCVITLGVFVFITACNDKDTSKRDLADIVLLIIENNAVKATILFKNEKANPACDYELEITKNGAVKLNIPETATGATSSPMKIDPGVYSFKLHCDATDTQVESVQNQTLEGKKTYELHAETDGTFEFAEVN